VWFEGVAAIEVLLKLFSGNTVIGVIGDTSLLGGMGSEIQGVKSNELFFMMITLHDRKSLPLISTIWVLGIPTRGGFSGLPMFLDFCNGGFVDCKACERLRLLGDGGGYEIPL